MTMPTESLDNLLRALHNAVIKAQELTEQQHIRQLARYFSDDGTPETRTIRIPDLRPETDDETREIEVPLLALVPPSAIKIKDFDIGFTVGLVGFTDASSETPGAAFVEGDPKTHSGPLRVDLAGGSGQDESVAQVRVTFEGTDPPEAFHRILGQLTITSIT